MLRKWWCQNICKDSICFVAVGIYKTLVSNVMGKRIQRHFNPMVLVLPSSVFGKYNTYRYTLRPSWISLWSDMTESYKKLDQSVDLALFANSLSLFADEKIFLCILQNYTKYLLVAKFSSRLLLANQPHRNSD